MLPFLLLIAAGASGAAPAQTAPELYMRDCAVCHLPGIAGAPKVGDRAEWSRRVRAGMAMVYLNAIEGIPFTAMTAKGGHTDLSDDQIRSIVDYMVGAAALDRKLLDAAARYEKLGIRDRDFIRLDANYDGFLSRTELSGDPVLLANFSRFDSSRDGRLSPAEYRKAEAALETERAAESVDDATLLANLRAELAKVKGLNLEYVKTAAGAGVVEMVGVVGDADIVREAYNRVKRTRGVKKIDNRLVSGEQIGWD